MSTPERRRFPRANAQIDCKCRRSARTSFDPARTIDISPTGARFELRAPRPADVGDRLSITFARSGPGLARADEMVTATVVRTDTPPSPDRPSNPTQHIAIEFDAPQSLALPTPSPTPAAA